MRVRRNCFRGGQRRRFAHLFQFADNAMLMDIHKTVFPLSGPQPADIFGGGGKMIVTS